MFTAQRMHLNYESQDADGLVPGYHGSNKFENAMKFITPVVKTCQRCCSTVKGMLSLAFAMQR